jgi:hypothetical protein
MAEDLGLDFEKELVLWQKVFSTKRLVEDW